MSSLKTTISVKADQFLKGMGQAKESVDKVESSTKKASKTIDDLGKTSKKTASSTNDLKTAQAAQALESMKQERNAKRANKALKEMEKSAKSVGTSISNALGSLSTGNIGGFISSIKDAGVSFKSLLPAATSGAGAVTTLTASFSAMGTAVYAALGPVGLVVGAIAAIGAVATKAIKSADSFDKALGDLSAITGASGAQLDYMAKKSKELSNEFGISAKEIMKSMGLVGSQAPELLKDADALAKVTQEAIVLSKASDMSVEDSGKAITGVMNMFDESFTEAKEIINTMAQSAMSGSKSIEYVTKAIEKSGTVAHMAGMNYHEAVAAIQTIGPGFESAEEGGTALKTVLLKLLTQSNNDFNPAIKGMKGALDNLAKAELSASEMQKIFGDSGIKAAELLIKQRKRFGELTEEITGTNTAYDQAAKKTTPLQEAWKLLKTACENLWEEIGHTEVMKALGALFIGLLNTVTRMIPYISKLAQVVDVVLVGAFKGLKWFVNDCKIGFEKFWDAVKDDMVINWFKNIVVELFEEFKQLIDDITDAYKTFRKFIGYETPASKIETEKKKSEDEKAEKSKTEAEKQQAAENRKKEEEAKKQAEREEEAARKAKQAARKRELEEEKRHRAQVEKQLENMQSEYDNKKSQYNLFKNMGLDTKPIKEDLGKLEEQMKSKGKEIGKAYTTEFANQVKTDWFNEIQKKLELGGGDKNKIKLKAFLDLDIDDAKKIKERIEKDLGNPQKVSVVDFSNPRVFFSNIDEEKEVLKKAYEDTSAKLKNKLDGDKRAWDDYTDAYQDYVDSYLDGIDDVRYHTETLISVFDELFNMDADANGWEWISAISTGISDIVSQIPTLVSGFEAIGAARQALASKNVTASQNEATAATMATGAEAGKALMSGTSSAAGIGFPQNIAAIAMVVATIMSVIGMIAGVVSKAKKHANGGIVGGSTHIGDNILTRLNAGEMVLNRRQQSHLFKMLDKGTVATSNAQPELSFRIKGEDLVGAIKNYNNKHR